MSVLPELLDSDAEQRSEGEISGPMEYSPIEALRPGPEGEPPHGPTSLRSESPVHTKSPGNPTGPTLSFSLINRDEQF